MTSTPSGLHSPDCRWWWNGEQWLPAYSDDGHWWFNGTTWTRPFPAWRLWTHPAGLVTFVVGILGASVGGLMSLGEPGPDHVKHVPSWFVPASFTTLAMTVVGLGLLLASPVHQVWARRTRALLRDTAPDHTTTETH